MIKKTKMKWQFTLRIALALVLVAGFVLVSMPQLMVFAGDAESPLQVRTLGTCADATSRGGAGGLHVLTFGLGLDGTQFADTDPTDATEPTNGTFNVSGIPAGASVLEAWLYWNGGDTGNNPEDNPTLFNYLTHDGDPTITFGGSAPITTTRVGGPVFFATSDFSYAQRINVTPIVAAGGNTTYALTGIDNLDNFVNGAELVVIYADPASDPQLVGLAEGLDLDPALEADTKPVFFQFDPAQVNRTAEVTVFLGGAGYGTPETTALYYRTDTDANLPPSPSSHTLITDTNATKVPDPFTGLNNQNGNGYWDSYTLNITVPAGHSWLAVQVDSESITGADARLEWVGATMNMPLACPELVVSKTRTSPDFVQPGEAVNYEIVVSNVGNTNVLTTTLQDTYDTTYLAYASANPAPDSTLNDGTLDWSNIGPINYGSAVTIIVNFTAVASTEPIVGPPADRTINTATVTGVEDENGNTDAPGNYPADDPNTPADENPLADTADVEITQPGVSISKGLVTPADGSTTVGSEVVYTITVSNTGDTVLNTVPVTDTYDTNFLSYGYGGTYSTPASDDNVDDGALSWANVGPLAVGASTTITVHFTAAASTQAEPSDQTVNRSGTNGVVDENGDSPSDVQDQAPVEIGSPDVSISKALVTPATGPAAVNDEVVFTITIRNTGDTVLTTVPVTDTYDTSFLSYGYGGTYSTPASDDNVDDGALSWANVGPLGVGASTTITVHFTAAASTTGQPNDETINYSGVSGVIDENNDPAPSAQDQAPVQIVNRGAIGDYVWYDANKNGIQDVTEGGLGNVTIDLKDGGGAIIQSTTTDADGGYLFTGVAPGTYTVDITDLNGVLSGLSATSGPQSQSEPFTVVLSPNEIYRDADFGYVYDSPQALVGDTVWYDPNQNGVRDPGEAGIPGVTVTLYDATTGLSTGLSDVTDLNGNYLITNVPPGTYYARATAGVPAGATPSSGAPNPTATFGIAAGDQYLDADIGYVLSTPSQIGGTVWNDTANGNGLLDEPPTAGIPGVSVDLLDDSGAVLATDTTDSNGDFSFPGLPAGTYQVRVSDTQNVLHNYDPTLIIGGTGDNTNKAQPYTITLPAGATDTTADFGYVLDNTGDNNGVIGNQVWYDVDGDGVYEPHAGDVGVEGVTVELLDGVGTVITSTTTGASGDYIFTSLPAGSYQVRVSDAYGVLTGYVDTTFPANQTADNNNKHQAYAISLSANEINLTGDFGYTDPAAIGDFVWYDADGDALQDVGEPGIPNVTLDLYDAGPDGALGGGDDTLLASTVSDADGGYLFSNLSPGTYYVDVTDLNGILSGFTHTTGLQSEPDPSNVVTLSPGEVDKDTDFGYVQQPVNDAIIGDTVFYDANADGIQQPEEPGIPGIIVCATPQGGGAPICDTTDSNGHYLLDVPAASYNVAPSSAPSGYTATTLTPHPVTVTAGDQYLDADFGYDSDTLLGAIGNLVFEDVDASGDYSATVDAPFVGVSVDLIRDSDGDTAWDSGEPIIATATTGANGDYLFSGVPAGNYLVHVSDTNAVLIDYVKAPLGVAGLDNNNQSDPYAIALASGGTNLTADFGYLPANRKDIAVLGNQVWVETDYDGLFDPAANDDFGQAGVTIDLYRNGSYYASTTTGASGDYSFTSLPSGVYTVTVADAKNILNGYLHTFYPADQTSDHTNKQEPYAVVLAQGASSMVSDFGYVLPATIGNYVWEDMDGDGAQDSGEPGITGIQVVLLNSVTGTPVFTTTTGAGGLYTFTDVPPGSYTVKFYPSGAYTFTVSNASGPGISDENDSDPDATTQETAAFAIAAGQTNDTLDAGMYQPVTLGDMIFRDNNGNKVQDASETEGVPNVPISITNLSTLQTWSTLSDANGIYTATNLPPGTYSVTVPDTLPLLIRTTDAPIQTTLLSGQSDLTVDFGYINPTAVQMTSVSYSISKKGVQLQWTTAAEDKNDTFSIYRATSENGVRKLLTPEPIPATGSPTGASYTFNDTLVTRGQTYYYWISIQPQNETVGPIVAPYFAPEPGDGGSYRLYAPLIVR